MKRDPHETDLACRLSAGYEADDLSLKASAYFFLRRPPFFFGAGFFLAISLSSSLMRTYPKLVEVTQAILALLGPTRREDLRWAHRWVLFSSRAVTLRACLGLPIRSCLRRLRVEPVEARSFS